MTNADDMLAVAASRADELAAPSLSPRPRRNVAVLSCMDTRIDLFPMLGLSAATRTSSATPAAS